VYIILKDAQFLFFKRIVTVLPTENEDKIACGNEMWKDLVDPHTAKQVAASGCVT